MSILQSELDKDPTLKAKIEGEILAMKNTDKLNKSDFQLEKMKKMFSELNFATDYRVFSLRDPFNSGRVSYFHKSLGGYHGAKLRKYNELIQYHLSGEYRILGTYFNNLTADAQVNVLPKLDIPVLNMLNTKYIIVDPNRQAVLNPFKYGNAWFVKEIEFVENADQEIMALSSLTEERAIVQSKFKESVDDGIVFDSTAHIELTSYLPNHLKYSSSSSHKQFAVFSEIYYEDGWDAYIDGKKVDYVKANYALRALNIPSGQHVIEFKFEPQTYYTGKKLSYAGSSLIIAFILAGIYLGYRTKERELETDEEI
jgi:hypothetical protein